MANQNFGVVHSLFYTWPIKAMKTWKNGQPSQISYFALCASTLS